MKSMDAADPAHPTVKPVPYTGVQFAAIPGFQGIGTDVEDVETIGGKRVSGPFSPAMVAAILSSALLRGIAPFSSCRQ